MKVISKNKGMALIIALILLLPLTLIAVSVMQWSKEDLKMIGAITDRNSAEQTLIGEMHEIMLTDNIAATLSTMSASSSVTTALSETSVNLTLRSEAICKRSNEPTSTNVYSSCRYIDADHEMNFGKGNVGRLQMTVNIQQPLLSNNGG
jgi:Tfp pilus assembly protein PilX